MDCIAVLYYWNGSMEELPVKREWIDDIVGAVEGQYTVTDNEQGFCIKGQNIMKVDIYAAGGNDEIKRCNTR